MARLTERAGRLHTGFDPLAVTVPSVDLDPNPNGTVPLDVERRPTSTKTFPPC